MINKQLYIPFMIAFLHATTCLFSQSTDSTLYNGNWRNPAIWSKGTIPAPTDYVVINHHVLLDTNVAMISPGTVYISATGELCGDYDFTGSFINYGPIKVHFITVTDTSYSYSQWIATGGVSVLPGGDWITYFPGSGCVGCLFTCDPVIPWQPPVANFINTNTTICAGKTIQFTDQSTHYALSWSWFFPGGIPSVSYQQNPIVTYNQPGIYDVTLVASNSVGSDTITKVNYVQVLPLPTVSASADVMIYYGESATLSASGTGTLLWNTGDTSLGITVNPTQTTTYTIIATNAYGCTADDFVTVNVEPCPNIFLPNAFSPNNDGENDFLRIYNIKFDCIETFALAIYDRWGEQVYETSDKTFQWDGTYPSQSLNTQVLTYHLSVGFTDGKAIDRKGNISLVR